MKKRTRHWLVSLALVSILAASFCLPGTALAATKTHQAIPQGAVCSSGLQYTITSYNRSVQHTTETAVADNDTGLTQTEEFISQHSVKKDFQVSVSFTVEAGVILEKVSATLGIQVTFSVTDAIGINTFVKGVPNGFSAIGNYGVFGVYTSGDYFFQTSKCQKSPDYGTVGAWSPYGFGWETKIVSG